MDVKKGAEWCIQYMRKVKKMIFYYSEEKRYFSADSK